LRGKQHEKTIEERSMKRLLMMVAGLVWVVAAQAASFDCAKAGTKVEHLICDNPELSKLDEELNLAYKTALQDEKQAVTIKQTQKNWIKERNGCVDTGCVKRAYESQLLVLRNNAVSTKHEATSLPARASATQLPIEEVACIAPKIDWRNYEWTLISGKGLAICDEMLAYVKSRPKNIAPPTCPEERLPPNGNWTRPESRILSEAEKQNLLRNIPERFQQKPNGPVSYQREIAERKLLRVIRGDITRDGIPESFLALGGYEDIQKTCERSKRCAYPEARFKKGIVLFSDAYDLLPMNDEGTQVNWSHRTVKSAPMLMGGELIFYKGLPFWMTGVSWDQNSSDDFAHYSTRPNDPYSAIFSLNGLGHAVVGQYGGEVKPAPFSEVEHIRGDGDFCRFGYFHRNNLKQNPPKARK
jgi:uncharacterized protein YecT (DUF1311 family)